MTRYSSLFEPGKIGSLELKNRLIMAAMGNHLAHGEGYVTDQLIDYYTSRARGGVGLIVTQIAVVSQDLQFPGRLAIFDEKFIAGLNELTDSIHHSGSKVVLQLMHHGMMAMAVCPEGSTIPVPSVLPWMEESNHVFKELSENDIERYVIDFAEGAGRAKKAGFDAVEIHGFHACMVGTFISPETNRRTDGYGGNPGNRARFAAEIITCARKEVGADFPLIFRGMGESAKQASSKVDEIVCQSIVLEKAGADAISLSTSPSYLDEYGLFIPVAQAIKKAVAVPVIVAGKIDLLRGDSALKEGKADFIALGRPLLADPELPNKAMNGRLDQIRQCIYCNNCNGEGVGGGSTRRRCTVNPGLFRERKFETVSRTSIPKKVVVVGGGIAGLQAARVLAERGHHVQLHERSNTLGGQWNIAAKQNNKSMYSSLTEYLKKHVVDTEIELFLNSEITIDSIKKIQPHTVVVAAGATPNILTVPVDAGVNVIQATELLMGNVSAHGRIVVIGGSTLGMEVSCTLAEEGESVCLLTRSQIGGSEGPEIALNFSILLQKLADLNVPLYPDSKIRGISDEGIVAVYQSKVILIKADTVVLAIGNKPERGLAEGIQALGSVNVFLVGDCVEPRDAATAIDEAAELAMRI